MQLALGGAILLLAFLAYLPALQGAFVFDDDVFLRNSALIRGPLRDIWATSRSPDYWPLTSTVWWIEWRLFGDRTVGYHLVGVALHAATAILFWRVLRSLSVPGSWLAGALFAVHPVAVESVAWISELKNTLSGVFFMCSLLFWVRWDRRERGRDLAASLLSFAVALLAKASVAPLPLVLAGVSWYRRRRLDRAVARALVPFLLLALAGGLVTMWFQHTNSLSGRYLPPRGVLERIGGAAWALSYYWRTAFLPTGLGFVHAPWPIGASSPWFFVPLLLVVGVFAALGSLRERTGPLLAALLFHTVMVFPVLGLVDMAYFAVGPVSNHLQYLAICGPVAFVAWAAARAAERWRAATAVVSSLAVIGLGTATALRASAFQGEIELWTEAVRSAPESAFAHYQLGVLLAQRGRTAEALRELEATTRVERDPAAWHHARSTWLLAAGRPDEAVAEGLEALRLRPDPEYARVLGVAMIRAGRAREAVPLLAELVRDHPDAEVRYWLAAALSREGRFAEAAEQLRKACAEAPDDEKLREALASVLGQVGAKE